MQLKMEHRYDKKKLLSLLENQYERWNVSSSVCLCFKKCIPFRFCSKKCSRDYQILLSKIKTKISVWETRSMLICALSAVQTSSDLAVVRDSLK